MGNLKPNGHWMNLCFSSNQNKVIVETNKGCIFISMAMLCILQTMLCHIISQFIESHSNTIYGELDILMLKRTRYPIWLIEVVQSFNIAQYKLKPFLYLLIFIIKCINIE